MSVPPRDEHPACGAERYGCICVLPEGHPGKHECGCPTDRHMIARQWDDEPNAG